GLEIQPAYGITTHFNDAPVRREMNKSNRDGDAVGIPRLCRDAGDRITFGIERAAAEVTRGVALDRSNLAGCPVNAPQTPTPFPGIESNKYALRRDVHGHGRD